MSLLGLILPTLCAGFLPATEAFAEDVIVVRSGDAAPYNVAAEAIERKLEGKRPIRNVLLPQLPAKTAKAEAGKGASFVAVGTRAAAFLNENLPKNATLAYCMVPDPESMGLTKRGHTCGVSAEVQVGEQFQLLGRALPRARRVGILYRSDNAASRNRIERLRESIPVQWQLEVVDVDSHESIAKALDELFRRQIDVIWTAGDRSVYSSASIRAVLLDGLRNRVPVFGFSAPVVRAGALLGVSVDPASQGTRAAELYLKLSNDEQGSAPQTTSGERHVGSDVHLVVNQIVAGQLRRKLPASLLKEAKHVFKQGSKR